MALSGDQGGSIRVPASFCGIVGLKPTFGLVPYTGICSAEYTVDHVGPMARTVQDVALLLEVSSCYLTRSVSISIDVVLRNYGVSGTLTETESLLLSNRKSQTSNFQLFLKFLL